MIERLKSKIDYTILKQSFIYTYLWGMITHVFIFVNLTISHDSLDEFYSSEQWAKANLGRFFYSIYITFTRGRFVIPWLIGILALCWIALSVYLILRMFRIEKKSLIMLITGICVTNPTVYALAATYIHDLDADMFALLLSVGAAFLWSEAIKTEKRKMQAALLGAGAILLSVSMGIYQSYMSVTITLIIFVSIQRLFERENPVEILLQGIWGIGMLAVSAVLYFIEAKIFSYISGIDILGRDSYNGLGNMSEMFSGNVLEKISGVYESFFTALENVVLTSYPAKVFWIVPAVLGICTVGMLILGIKKIDLKSKILLVLLIIIMPFGMNISYFLSNGEIHVLMQYAVWFVWLLAAIMIPFLEKEQSIHRIVRSGVIYTVMGCVLLIAAENVQTANTVYVKKELEYQSTLAYMTRVADEMEEQEGYVPGVTPVLFVGKNVGEYRDGFERYNLITGASIAGPITYYDTYTAYFEYVLGRPIVSIENDDLKYGSEVYTMPAYPQPGSIRMVEGTMVVKMRE